MQLKDEIEVALGHVCVPFSTEEEADEGRDALILFFLEGTKAVIKERDSKESAGLLLNEIFRSLSDGGHFDGLVARLQDSVAMIEVYKIGTPDQKRQIKQKLKARGLL